MNIRLIAWLIATALMGVVAYLVLSFSLWDLNPVNWPILARFGLAALPAYFAIKTFDQIEVDE